MTPNRAEVVRGVDRMLGALIHEVHPVGVDTGPLVAAFNDLLQQARDQFRDSETLRLIDALGPGASVPLIIVRLSLIKRALGAEMPAAPPERPEAANRRRWPRYKVAWPVGLVVGDAEPIVTRTLDVSLYGVGLTLSPELAACLRASETYRFEVHVPEREARFARSGKICYIGEDSIGLRTLEPLPEAIILAPASEARPEEVRAAIVAPAAPKRLERLRTLLALLRARAMFRAM